ncbi:MAG: hypothetical protein ACF8NJ_01415 [Phycisphaerales bacterium JB038]
MRSRSALSRLSLVAACLLLGGLPLAGCQVGQLLGGMAASYERTGTHEVAYEYGGLQEKSFAVFVSAGKEIQYEFPELMDAFAGGIAEKLAESAGASGWVPYTAVRWYQSRNPYWEALSYSDITKALGVDRLVMVDLYEYRLHRPGNPYLWDGVVAAKVGVVEAESSIPDEFIFEREVQVAFPNKSGVSPADMTRDQVITGLNSKFRRDVCWLFYTHEEPNYEG